MVHYNDIQEGQTVKYFGHDCKVEEKTQGKDGIYYVTMSYPNPLMMNVICHEQSSDGYFKDISL